MNQRALKISTLISLAFAGVFLAVFGSGCGATSDAQVRSLGNTTTKQAVVGALASTGYKLRYRQVPHLAEYDVVAGEALDGPARVQFAVEIRRAGPFSEITDVAEENPQPAIVRYGVEDRATVVGNVLYTLEIQHPRVAGRGVELETSKAERSMLIRVGLALERLFASKFRTGV